MPLRGRARWRIVVGGEERLNRAGWRKGGAVTEEEWLACADPQNMLEFLRRKTSNRKLRLWGCACCRRMWHLLSDTGRVAVEATESWAVGRLSGRKLEQISRQIYQEIGPAESGTGSAGRRYAAAAVWRATSDTAHQITHTGRSGP
jgi:hypothetical protein